MKQPITKRSRRAFLATLGTATAAGCIGNSSPDSEFSLEALELDNVTEGRDRLGPTYLMDPIEIESYYAVDYSTEYKRSKMDELVETGTVSTREWPLVDRRDWGRTKRDRRRCLEYDGTYYRVRTEDVVQRQNERWVFYLRRDERRRRPPDGATVTQLPVKSLSKQDRRMVAEMMTDADEDPFDGVVLHDGLDPEASDLVPSPPFDYLEHDGKYFQATSGTEIRNETERTFSVEAVAQSRSEYEQYAKETYPDADYDELELSEDAEAVLDDATSRRDPYEYEEEPPMSDALEEVLRPLGIAEALEPHESYDGPVRFKGALARYDRSWYEFDLTLLVF